MNTKKFGMGNCGLFSEADRTMYIDKATGEYKQTNQKDTVSKSIIDFTKTHLNYNLCPHEQYRGWEVKAINEKIRGKKMPKNAVAWGSTIISLPKDYDGDPRTFFETSYEGMKKMYGLKDEDVVSAYVHMDESTPHMHFYFVPVVHEAEKERVSWDKVMPRKMYKSQHEVLQRYMREKIPDATINLLNGETIGIDVSKMDANQRKASIDLDETLKKLQQANEAFDTVQMATDEVYKPYIDVVERLTSQLEALTPKQRTNEKDVFDLLKESNIIFGKGNLEDIRKATECLEGESSRIEADYLSIDDDDDFEL